MSRIEDLVYSAYEHGKREVLFNEISKIKLENPSMKLEENIRSCLSKCNEDINMKFALIAHDNKKADMVAFVSKRLPFFNRGGC